MPNRVNTKVTRSSNSSWEAPLADVREKLNNARQRVRCLQKVLKNWQKLRDQGMPWPGAAESKPSKELEASRG